MLEDIKRIVKVIAVLVVIIYVISIVAGAISYFTSPPSYAGYDDNVIIDIGNDGYLVANITNALEYKSKNIPDGEVNGSHGIVKWKDARNVSFVYSAGHKCYAIAWKTPLEDSGLKVIDKNKLAYIYGTIFNQNHMHAVYYLQYNPQNKQVYGIILDNNGYRFDLNDLLYDILGFDKSEVVYNDYSGHSSSGGGRYGGVDTSPSTIAYNDPDWYYDYYDYGDYDYYDEYLESEGYD